MNAGKVIFCAVRHASVRAILNVQSDWNGRGAAWCLERCAEHTANHNQDAGRLTQSCPSRWRLPGASPRDDSGLVACRPIEMAAADRVFRWRLCQADLWQSTPTPATGAPRTRYCAL
jgi:hypothetical protein